MKLLTDSVRSTVAASSSFAFSSGVSALQKKNMALARSARAFCRSSVEREEPIM